MERGGRLTGEYAPDYISLRFADGVYTFRLNLPQIAELQEKVPSAIGPSQMGAGIGTIYRRLLSGEYYYEDLWQIIRLGLIGGASGIVLPEEKQVEVTPLMADRLMDRYVRTAPQLERYNTAVAVAVALMQGYSPPATDKPPPEGEDEGE